MPFVSRAQRRFMYSKDPNMAHKFEQKTPKDKQLPERVRPRKVGVKKGEEPIERETLQEIKQVRRDMSKLLVRKPSRRVKKSVRVIG